MEDECHHDHKEQQSIDYISHNVHAEDETSYHLEQRRISMLVNDTVWGKVAIEELNDPYEEEAEINDSRGHRDRDGKVLDLIKKG